jgi:hypothetical protein
MRERELGKEPEYRRQQKIAAEDRQNTERHKDILRTILTLTTSIDSISAEHAASRQQAARHEEGKRKRDLFTFSALVVTAAAALLTLTVTHCDTRDLITETRTAADQQHKDTLAALGKTDDSIKALQEQARIMSNQLGVSRDEFTATQRPWISIDSVTPYAGLIWVNNSADITGSVNFVLTNSGRTPGVHIFPWVTLVLMTTGNLAEIIDKTTAYCEPRRKPYESSSAQAGLLIPPNKTIAYPSAMQFQLSNDEIRAGIQKFNGRDAIIPYVGGCIRYEFSFGKREGHETWFIYRLLGPDNVVFVDKNTNIAPNQIHLEETEGGWAD